MELEIIRLVSNQVILPPQKAPSIALPSTVEPVTCIKNAFKVIRGDYLRHKSSGFCDPALGNENDDSWAPAFGGTCRQSLIDGARTPDPIRSTGHCLDDQKALTGSCFLEEEHNINIDPTTWPEYLISDNPGKVAEGDYRGVQGGLAVLGSSRLRQPVIKNQGQHLERASSLGNPSTLKARSKRKKLSSVDHNPLDPMLPSEGFVHTESTTVELQQPGWRIKQLNTEAIPSGSAILGEPSGPISPVAMRTECHESNNSHALDTLICQYSVHNDSLTQEHDLGSYESTDWHEFLALPKFEDLLNTGIAGYENGPVPQNHQTCDDGINLDNFAFTFTALDAIADPESSNLEHVDLSE